MESLPSKEIVAFDIPEVDNFIAEFQYNFFVHDESTSETGGIDETLLERPAESFDSKTQDYLSSRFPRWVKFTFKPATIYDPIATFNEEEARERNYAKFNDGGLIRNNYDKILSEDDMTHFNFMSSNYQDVDINSKIYELLSGSRSYLKNEKTQSPNSKGNTTSADQDHGQRLESKNAKNIIAKANAAHEFGNHRSRIENDDDDHGHHGSVALQDSLFSAAHKINAVTPKNITHKFIAKYGVQHHHDKVVFLNKEKKKIRKKEPHNNVITHVLLNNKFAYDVINNSAFDPMSSFSDELVPLANLTKVMQANALGKSKSDTLDDEDFNTEVNYIDIKKAQSTDFKARARVIGYVIDKVELLRNGHARHHDPIIIDNPYANTTVDFKVKYGSTYTYNIRTIVKIVFPAITHDTNDIVLTTCLLTSKPSHKRIVHCHEEVPPPPPTDFEPRWDFAEDRLVLLWSFPPNLQRDIKKFLIFRRDDIEEAFQLIGMYDFDDSDIKQPFHLHVHSELIHKMVNNPRTFFVDREFRKNSKYIYALATADAHGLISNYSEQYHVSFDRFKNQLVKKRISPSDAPLTYPNFYFDSDVFVDAIHDHGHKVVNVIFHPEFMTLHDDDHRVIPVTQTTKTHGFYRLQFINTDLQKMQVVRISIDDRRTSKRKQKKYGKKEHLKNKTIPQRKSAV